MYFHIYLVFKFERVIPAIVLKTVKRCMVEFWTDVCCALPNLQVIISEETFTGVYNMSFTISLSRPALVFSDEALLRLYKGLDLYALVTSLRISCLVSFRAWYLGAEKTKSSATAGNTQFAQALQVFLRSRDSHNLKTEFQAGKGKVSPMCRYAWFFIIRRGNIDLYPIANPLRDPI